MAQIFWKRDAGFLSPCPEAGSQHTSPARVFPFQIFIRRFSYIFFNPVPFFAKIRYNISTYSKFIKASSKYTLWRQVPRSEGAYGKVCPSGIPLFGISQKNLPAPHTAYSANEDYPSAFGIFASNCLSVIGLSLSACMRHIQRITMNESIPAHLEYLIRFASGDEIFIVNLHAPGCGRTTVP